MGYKITFISLAVLFTTAWLSIIEWIEKLIIPNMSVLQMSTGNGYIVYNILKSIFGSAEIGGLIIGIIAIIIIIFYKPNNGDNYEE